METALQKILSLLKQTYSKDAWHGPSVKEVLENITAEQSLKKLPNTQSIIELVCHMTSWRIYVIKRTTGDLDYQVAQELNFPQDKNWNECLRQLEQSQEKLISAIQKFPAAKLEEMVPNSETPHNYYQLLHGIIHHDLYHAGQIVLIKKATAQQTF